MFELSHLLGVGRVFAIIMGELILLFIGISFIVALIQKYISQKTIQQVLSTPRKGLNSIMGAALGAVTPFCSCSTVPILVALFKSGAPFGGTMSFLISSPMINPAIVILFLAFFGLKATLVYVILTFSFAVFAGIILDKMGMQDQVKKVTIKGAIHEKELVYENLKGSFLSKNVVLFKASLNEAIELFKQVLPYLGIGAGVGAFIYGFVPENLLMSLAGRSNLLSIPIAAIIGIPMYIRTETMIPIAGILISKGVSPGTMIALIIGGAGASIPELTLLGSIFKKKMMVAFVSSIFIVAVVTGFVFNIIW